MECTLNRKEQDLTNYQIEYESLRSSTRALHDEIQYKYDELRDKYNLIKNEYEVYKLEKDRSEADYKQQLYTKNAQITELDNNRLEQDRMINH